ncbi:FAD-binding oxidoreductase [Oceanicella sp. SM1341]|uniref:NAD(P)/FAD-dependent oxidoreductase n=1 Tax=Oceanicella sp. SM1341 TaxID=1548889 RepID=UPI000E4D3528|nr:FAD-binding oxidoreductase [Oceanicella sp. SM1341]
MSSADLLHWNDRPGQHAPSWYAESARPFPDQPPLAGDVTADVCVVGGGFTGLSAALHLAERGFSVRVLEAHRAGWGASGRNGGQVASGQRIAQDEIEQMVGREHARRAFDIGTGAAQLVRDLIDRHGIDCAYKPGVMEANHRKRFDSHAKHYVEKLRSEYDYHSVRYLEPAEVSDMLGTKVFSAGMIDMASGHIHPLNFARGLAAAALSAGAVINERSQVTGISQGPKVTVRTEGGSVTADHLILACNGYIGDLEPETNARVQPINSYVIATEPLSEELAAEVNRDDVAIFDTRFVVNYWRLSEDRRMIFGGRESYGYRFPDDIKESVFRRMLTLYPQLSHVKVTHGWGGTLGITWSRLPCFRRVGGNILSLSGYSGSGVAMATMAGQIGAETIAGQAERFDVMAGLPTKPFPGGPGFRHALMSLGMLWFSLRDRL